MSYDVHLLAPTGGEPVEAYWANMTSNVAPMWRAAGCDLAAFDGASATALADNLVPAIAAMESNPETFKAMNPPNGWGDYDGCLRFLRELRDACRLYPATEVRVSR